jgi:hypothetical protein
VRVAQLLPIVLAAGAAGCLGGGHRATATFEGGAESCAMPRTYTPSLTPARGSPGTTVLLTGVLPVRNEAGNLEPRRWVSAVAENRTPAPARPGAVAQVSTVTVPRPAPCRYSIPFTVPNVPEGRYPVELLYFGGGSAARSRPAIFTVTS